MNSPNNRGISDLVGDAFSQLAKLVANEFDLARAEMSEKATQVGRAAAMIGAGAVIMIPALVVLLFGVAAALVSKGLSQPAAYFLTGAGAAIISGGLVWTGISRLSGGALMPSVTMNEISRDKAAVKEMVR
jgi:hypothetical protein